MNLVIGLFALGVIVVIVTQFVKSGSSGPTVIKNVFGNVARYLNLLK